MTTTKWERKNLSEYLKFQFFRGCQNMHDIVKSCISRTAHTHTLLCTLGALLPLSPPLERSTLLYCHTVQYTVYTIQIANLFLCKQISLQFSCEFLFIQYILFAASVEIKVKCCCFSFFWYSVQFICIIKGIDGCHMLHSPLMYCF